MGKPTWVFCIWACLLAMALFAPCAGKASGSTWIVDDDEGWWTDYTNIQDAIDNASKGDVIRVFNGTYYGYHSLENEVQMYGNGTEHTIVNALDNWSGFDVNSDNVHIEGFTIFNTDRWIPSDPGITLLGSKNLTAINCKLYDGRHGIFLNDTRDNYFANIEIFDMSFGNTSAGIFIDGWDTHDTIFENITIHDANNGITIRDGCDLEFRNCTIFNGTSTGVYLPSYSTSRITFTGLEIWNTRGTGFFIDGRNNGIKMIDCSVNNSEWSGILIENCYDEMLIDNCTLFNNGHNGIKIFESGEVKIMNSTIHNNTIDGINLEECYYNVVLIDNCTIFENGRTGIKVYQSDEVTIMSNTIHNNTLDGINLEESKDNFIEYCYISNNGIDGINLTIENERNVIRRCNITSNRDYAIYICGGSKENEIYHNNIFDHTLSSQACDDNGNNDWDDGSFGNYWSDYIGYDDDGNGIGDQPYSIGGRGRAKDRYPLMTPLNGTGPRNIPEFSTMVLVSLSMFIIIAMMRRRHGGSDKELIGCLFAIATIGVLVSASTLAPSFGQTEQDGSLHNRVILFSNGEENLKNEADVAETRAEEMGGVLEMIEDRIEGIPWYQDLERPTEFDLVDIEYDMTPYTWEEPISLYVNYPTDDEGIVVQIIQGEKHYNPTKLNLKGLHYLHAYRDTGDIRYLERTELFAGKLIEMATESNGAIWLPFDFDRPLVGMEESMEGPWFSGMTQGQGLSLFSRLYEETGNAIYKGMADGLFRSLTSEKEELRQGDPWVACRDDDGYYWVEEYPLEEPMHVLNGFIYAIYGMYDYYQLTEDEECLDMFEESLITVAHYAPMYRNRKELSRYCLGSDIVLDQYHQKHITQLNTLKQMSGDGFFSLLASRLKWDEMKYWEERNTPR